MPSHRAAACLVAAVFSACDAVPTTAPRADVPQSADVTAADATAADATAADATAADATAADVTAADATSADVTAADVAADDAVDPDDVPPCSVRPDAAGVACVLRVHGHATDFTGAPLADHVITYCSAVCYGATTDARGDFSMPVGDFVDPSQYTLLVHGRPDHASLYLPTPAPVDGTVTFTEPLTVPRYEAVGPALPDRMGGGTFTAGDVTITVPDGAHIETDIEDSLLGDLGRRLRTVAVPMDRAPRFARDANVVALWALGPFGYLIDQPVAVRVPNRAGLAPNTAVEFVVLGREVTTVPLDGGRALVAATGAVSADGATIATGAGQGIRYLTWLGVRPRAASR